MLKYSLIPFLPLSAFIISGLLGHWLKERAHWPSIIAVLASFVLAVSTLFDVMGGKTVNTVLYSWILSGTFDVHIGFKIDQLTAVMLIVVTTVSSLVHIYSTGYMHGDKGYPRFFAYLSLFTFSMLMLVMADNFLQLYVFWEAVGLCSYFLIGFWYEKKSASDAGKKAFVVNRVGDFGFGLGVMLIFISFGTLNYDAVFAQVAGQAGQTVSILGNTYSLFTVIALLLFTGAMGKSAQLPLHVWLPDAMEGPTPVSALIHAATMVTAGVFMVARCHPIFNQSQTALDVVTWTGGITAIFAATIALTQYRYQEGHRLLHHKPAWVHVRRMRRGRIRGRHIPPDDPRVLQGPSLPGRRQRHPCPFRGAGHEEDGRASQEDTMDIYYVPACIHIDFRHTALCRLLQQGRDSLEGLHRRVCRTCRLFFACACSLYYSLLFVQADIHDFLPGVEGRP